MPVRLLRSPNGHGLRPPWVAARGKKGFLPPQTPPSSPKPALLEHFQFEMLCISNHTACRFAKKTRFFRSLWAGRRCTASARYIFKGKTISHTCLLVNTCRGFHCLLKKRAEEKMGGLGGRAQPFHSAARKGVLVVLSREQRPNGGRRPCPLRRRKLRASTAEMRGFPSPQQSTEPDAKSPPQENLRRAFLHQGHGVRATRPQEG